MQETTGTSTHKENLSEYTGQYRKTLFTPSRTQCEGTTNTFEDKYQTMEDPNKAEPQMWKGETAFRIKKGTKLPETLQQQFATKTQQRSEPQRITPQVIHYNPRTRLREKRTPPRVDRTEKAHTGREYMLRLEQRFTRQSRHTTGQTWKQTKEEKDNTQDC